MNYKTRIHLLKKISANSGILTSFVENNLKKENFKKQFLSIPEGPEREKLAYDAIIANGPPQNLVPITVDGPNGIKITYNVMPDYVMVNGVRVTMSPATAQRVANHFNMKLPTDKMSQQIYNAADTKVRAIPLSSQGYVGSDGKHYSGQDVVQNRIGKSDAALTYNHLTNEEIKKQETLKGKPSVLIAGHGKDILQPTGNPNDVRIGGWQGNEGKALQPYSDTHKGEAAHHTEYGLYTRLIGNDVKLTTPDGKVITTTMDELLNNPSLSKSISNLPGTKKYFTSI